MFSRQVKFIELRPIKESSQDYDEIERKIKLLFKEEIYLPLVRALGGNSKTIKNAAYSLVDAIKFGRIQFNRGRFTGKFNAGISQELRALGAVWDNKTSSFRISLSELPFDVTYAIRASVAHFEAKIAGIDKKLAQIVPAEIAGKLNISKNFDSALWKVEKEFSKTIAGITIKPQLSDSARERIAEEWQNNMDLWIKDFVESEIVELRQKMQKTVFAGNRYETAIKTIQKSYDVSANKAKFLARQETSLLVTKYKETRYTEAGVDEYKWGAVAGTAAHPTRPRHKALADASKAGKIFRWDDPPVTTAPGEPERRNNPGQDFNCRCFAIPVVRFKGKK